MTTIRKPTNALATIELFRHEDGGFQKPLMPRRWLSTIRVNDGTKMHYSVGVDVDEELSPGDVRQVYIAFGVPELLEPLLKPGTEILYCEGRAVGKGTILELYPDGNGPAEV